MIKDGDKMKTYLVHIKNIMHDIFFQWRILLLFEFLYKLLGGIILFPFFNYLIQETLAAADLPYLYLDNIKIWLFSPLTLPLLFLCFLLFGIYILYEISILVQYFHFARIHHPMTFSELITTSFKQNIHILKPRNWIFLIILLLIFPLTMFSLTPTALLQVRVPEYFTDFFKEHGNFYSLYLMVIVILNIFVFSMLFTLPAFLIEKKDFVDAFKRSRQLIKTRFIKTMLSYVFWLISLIGLFFLVCGIFLLILVIRYFFLPDTKDYAAQFLLNYMLLKQFAGFLFQSGLFTGSVAIMMYMYQNYTGVPILAKRKKAKRSLKIFLISIMELLILFIALNIYFDYQGNIYDQYNLMEKPMEIAAHRAGTAFTPENTIPALNNAIHIKADYAEIDVQQTKDGQLYILHDTNLKRTTGIDKNIWDVTSDEIKNYDAGRYYNASFSGTPIPTLEEMIQTADHKIKLMIELKKNGHEDQLEEKTIALIQKYQFEDQCVIASMDLDILIKVKELNPQLKTVYIAPVVYGEYYDLDFIDIFSVESTFVNRTMIERLHLEGKSVFVWTVNKENEMKRLFSMNIDGMVTDHPKLASYYKGLGRQDEFIQDLMTWLFPNS